MARKNIDVIKNLDFPAENIRNISIIAHVDHGKTTLADVLLVSNQIISKKLAGQLRLMDNLEEEQLRGITMKSSSTSLLYTCPTTLKPHLINIIDSPGHIDFCNEVSAAVRLSEGALFIVDVVEGVCPQTRAVLSQAWQESVQPLLVLNKMDRLLTELNLTPAEAQLHIMRTLEQVNSILAELRNAQLINSDDPTVSTAQEHDEESLYFSPSRGNVLFASAKDNWAFRVDEFAKMYSRKLSCREDVLRQTLWGDFYFQSKDKKIKPAALEQQRDTLFVNFILKPLWTLYHALLDTAPVSAQERLAKLEKMVSALGVSLTPRDLGMKDVHGLVKLVMSSWLPLAECVFAACVQHLPSPALLSDTKLLCLLKQPKFRLEELDNMVDRHRQAVQVCSRAPQSPTLLFIAKFLLNQHEEYFHSSQPAAANQGSSNDADLMAFGRIYSGCVRAGDKLFLLGPNFHARKSGTSGTWEASLHPRDLPCGPLEQHSHAFVVQVQSVFCFYGRECTPVGEQCAAPAGNIIGLKLSLHECNSTQQLSADLDAGLASTLPPPRRRPHFKTATLSSALVVSTFADLTAVCDPIVCVALEPIHVTQLKEMEDALLLMEQVDSSVKVHMAKNGEILLYTAGEVHLDKCLEDLRKRFIPHIAFTTSPFIVPFRETLTAASLHSHCVVGGGGGAATMRILVDAVPLPQRVQAFLDKQLHGITKLCSGRCSETERQELLHGLHQALCHFEDCDELLEEELHKHRSLLRTLGGQHSGNSSNTFTEQQLAHCLWAFGEKSSSTHHEGNNDQHEDDDGENVETHSATHNSNDHCNLLFSLMPLTYDSAPFGAPNDKQLHKKHRKQQQVGANYPLSCVHGYHMACRAGPLCAEPLRGVAFVLQSIDIDNGAESSNSSDNEEENEQEKECPVVCLEDANLPGNNDHPQGVLPATRESGAEAAATTRRPVFHCSVGQLTAAVSKACLQAFQSSPQQRLLLAMYQLDAQVRDDVIGKLHAVLARRYASIFYQDLVAGTSTFLIRCHVPVVESFGLCDELRKRTSGLAMPQMRWSHWQLLDGDPNTDPPLGGGANDEEEDNEVGEKEQKSSYTDWVRAVRYYNDIRRRKGLSTRQQIVAFAEKQRNLSKKK